MTNESAFIMNSLNVKIMKQTIFRLSTMQRSFSSAATLLYDPIDMEFYPAAESLIVSLEAGARRWPICHGRPNAGLGM